MSLKHAMDSPILILLAGGKSSRMGTPKGLLDYYGNPWILEQILRYKNIENPRIYIGLGFDYEQYIEKIPWFKGAIKHAYFYSGVKVRVFINEYPDLGPFSTLQIVLKKIESKDSVLVLPIDVPLLDFKNLKVLIVENNKAVIPVYNGNNGHPVKLDYGFWKILLSINLKSKMARLNLQIKQMNALNKTYIAVSSCSICQNINTLEQWKSYLNR
jgi:molybdopterin-guanine dinucleotide biosynthesis protein A